MRRPGDRRAWPRRVRRRVDRSRENDATSSATRKSLLLTSKSKMLTSKSLFLTSKSEMLTSKSLFLTSKSKMLASKSLLLSTKPARASTTFSQPGTKSYWISSKFYPRPSRFSSWRNKSARRPTKLAPQTKKFYRQAIQF